MYTVLTSSDAESRQFEGIQKHSQQSWCFGSTLHEIVSFPNLTCTHNQIYQLINNYPPPPQKKKKVG